MKQLWKTIVAIVFVLLPCVLVCIWLYDVRINEWREVASRTLRNSLKEEINQRETKMALRISSKANYKRLTESDFPMKVGITTEKGSREYEITWVEHKQNIESNPRIRSRHTILLQSYPFSAEILAKHWRDSLQVSGFRTKGLLRMCALDVNSGKENCTYIGDSVRIAQADSLGTFVVGYACEIAVTGFLSYHWWQVYLLSDWIWILSLLFFIGGLVVWIWKYYPVIKERYFIKKIEVEKPVLVAAVEFPYVQCCQLPDGTLFDKEHGILQKGTRKGKLSRLENELLWMLVNAKNEAISIDRLKEALWSAKVESNSSVYTTIHRLREKMTKVSSFTIKNEGGSYRLTTSELKD